MYRRYTMLRVSAQLVSQNIFLIMLLPEYVVDRGLQDDAFLVPTLPRRTITCLPICYGSAPK